MIPNNKDRNQIKMIIKNINPTLVKSKPLAPKQKKKIIKA